MPTPGITGGVFEGVKPRRYLSNVVWRFEAVLGASASITTPIFDVVGDGFPLTEIEIGTFSVVRVPSNRFHVAVLIQTTPNMKLTMNLIQDNGGTQPYRLLYVPLAADVEVHLFDFTCPGRRCQFRLANTPFGTGGAAGSDTRFEISVEGA